MFTELLAPLYIVVMLLILSIGVYVTFLWPFHLHDVIKSRDRAKVQEVVTEEVRAQFQQQPHEPTFAEDEKWRFWTWRCSCGSRTKGITVTGRSRADAEKSYQGHLAYVAGITAFPPLDIEEALDQKVRERVREIANERRRAKGKPDLPEEKYWG
jgi:hypothetical protein